MVAFDDGTGIRYSVQVTAETVFEAAALALQIFEDARHAAGVGRPSRNRGLAASR
jgi:hypothetical protein